MEAAINSDPELAIGTAKEFLETVCNTILTERGIAHAKDEQIPSFFGLIKAHIGGVIIK
jgi:hypothetical protein